MAQQEQTHRPVALVTGAASGIGAACAHAIMVKGGAELVVIDRDEQDLTAVVIAHSLGSVVTYETLWAHPQQRVDLLITLGSPLAMPDVIFDKLHPVPEHRKGQRPPGVRRWINIAEPGDVIAIPRPLASNSIACSISACADNTTMPVVGNSWRITRAASNPSVVCVGGIRISTTTSSGACSRTNASNCGPSPA